MLRCSLKIPNFSDFHFSTSSTLWHLFLQVCKFELNFDNVLINCCHSSTKRAVIVQLGIRKREFYLPARSYIYRRHRTILRTMIKKWTCPFLSSRNRQTKHSRFNTPKKRTRFFPFSSTLPSPGPRHPPATQPPLRSRYLDAPGSGGAVQQQWFTI